MCVDLCVCGWVDVHSTHVVLLKYMSPHSRFEKPSAETPLNVSA